jgi:hypothetical protein
MSMGDVHPQDILNADSAEAFLRQNEVGVLIEDGGICPVISRDARGADYQFDSCNP